MIGRKSVVKSINAHVVIVVSIMLIPIVGLANDQECEPITIKESSELHNQIEGSVEPENIPRWLKYRVFVSMFSIYANDLVQDLSPADYAILNNLIVGTEYWQQIENDRYANESRALCARSASLDTVTFAREYEGIAADTNNRAGNRVENTISSLSSPGQRIIEGFIQTRVVPKLAFPRTDSVDFALRDPEGARENLDIMCYTMVNGEPPPEIKKMMECLRQQMGNASIDDLLNQVIAIRPELSNQQ